MIIKNDPSGIDFNNLSNSNIAWKIPVKSDGTYRLGSSKNDLRYANEDGVMPIINAVEIDWNGAELGNTYDGISRINTTGDLIKVLQR